MRDEGRIMRIESNLCLTMTVLILLSLSPCTFKVAQLGIQQWQQLQDVA